MMRKLYFIVLIILQAACTSAQEGVILGKRISKDTPYAISLPNAQNPNHVRLEVRKGEIASNGGRAEIMAENSGFEQDYSFEFKVVKFAYEQNKHFIIADWHHSTALHNLAKEKGETLFSPIVIHIVGNSIVLADRAGRYVGEVGSLKENSKFKMNLMKVPLKMNEWNKISIKIRWAENNTGAIDASINGIRVNKENIRTTYSMKYPNFFKLGIYRNLTYDNDSVLEFRNMKVGGKALVPNFNRKLTGEKNNNEKIIKSVKEKYRN